MASSHCPASTGLPSAARLPGADAGAGPPGESHSPGAPGPPLPATDRAARVPGAPDPALPQADLQLLSPAPECACHLCPQAGDTGPPACQQACLPACLTLSVFSPKIECEAPTLPSCLSVHWARPDLPLGHSPSQECPVAFGMMETPSVG